MSVSSYLENMASNLIIGEDEDIKIDRSIDYLRKNLERYFGEEVKKNFLFGSYIRKTNLPRKADSKSDIDYMILFNNANEYKPQTFLDRLRRFVNFYYSSSEIKQSHPTIVLELSHIKFELVPAYQNYFDQVLNQYNIPSRSSEYTDWIKTDPISFNKQIDEKHSSENYKIKPVIRLLKYWNKSAGGVFSSYELETKIAEQNYWWCSNLKDYFFKAFEAINYTWMDSQHKINKIKNMKITIENIKYYDERNQHFDAETYFKKLLPPL
ncbi:MULTISPECIES: SMODS domain-containing nucleotidyltransferase [Bacillus cereus group]|uniref:SMODS domain-containing nucleotidyltransferase n=1 Tax=Bacillus cereus group TaxID=86661 RepID=UPI000BF9A67B|nr:nucleotidyltransferase domain-containing protein [Bacillus cereus]PFA37441.1 nucleotidyltransferase [Bacillus cereus]HDR8028818.1 nucleotidyltransferase domain-containing protein [Bacillus cereus]HDR8429843.1 nucleotidyltransferase domain-containing protein [Bacillus cereus]HDR8447366.1 nucleotidyltransferase domain-containing protein [Bacillus cereus]